MARSASFGLLAGVTRTNPRRSSIPGVTGWSNSKTSSSCLFKFKLFIQEKHQQWGYKQCTRHSKSTLREYLNNIQNHNKILSNTVVNKYHVYLIAWWADCEHRHHSIFMNPHDIFIISIFILPLHIQWDNHWCQSPAIQIKGLKPQRVYLSL